MVIRADWAGERVPPQQQQQQHRPIAPSSLFPFFFIQATAEHAVHCLKKYIVPLFDGASSVLLHLDDELEAERDGERPVDRARRERRELCGERRRCSSR